MEKMTSNLGDKEIAFFFSLDSDAAEATWGDAKLSIFRHQKKLNIVEEIVF